MMKHVFEIVVLLNVLFVPNYILGNESNSIKNVNINQATLTQIDNGGDSLTDNFEKSIEKYIITAFILFILHLIVSIYVRERHSPNLIFVLWAYLNIISLFGIIGYIIGKMYFWYDFFILLFIIIGFFVRKIATINRFTYYLIIFLSDSLIFSFYCVLVLASF